MILVISDIIDQSEMEVYDWLNYLGARCEIISSIDFHQKIKLLYSNSNHEFTMFYGKDKFEKVSSLWIRRDRFSATNFLQSTISNDVSILLDFEADTLKDFILNDKYNNINLLSSYQNKKLNKLDVLEKAGDIGLNVPEYLITNQKKYLQEFVLKHKKVICKASFENLRFIENDKAFFQYVEVLETDDLEKITDSFFISFFQKYIYQKYELRIFYFNGIVYAMANILRAGLTGDIRRTDYVTRKVPYVVNINDSDKISKLMENLNLNVGALDFIIDENDKLYFLEVNPNGNFSNLSKSCNYNLEEIVANYLIYGK